MNTVKVSQKTQEFLNSKAPLPFFLGGRSETSDQPFPVINPATGERLCDVALGHAETVNAAVKAGEEAFKDWGKAEPKFRAQILQKLADLIDRDQQVLADLECVDVGKPVSAALGFDVPFASQCFRYFADLALNTEYEVELGLSATESQTIKRPYGVAAFVFPWNFPLTLCAWGIGPALAAGNTVVVKPASETPLSTLYLGKLMQEAGFPAGVFNIIPGKGAEVGEALINHPDIKLMSFTGSTVIGKRVGEICGKNLVPAKLELGGKGAALVCADIDIEQAAEGLAGAIMLNAGQVCCTSTRWYIHELVYDEFVAKVKEKFAAACVGNGMNPATTMGPMCTKKQLLKVLQCIDEAKAHGAEVVTGGKRIMQGDFAKGYFMEPTLLAGKDDNPWAQEEIFGPVAFLLKFRDEQECVERINKNHYGLANSVWSKDLPKAKKLACDLVGGNSWINAHNVFEYGLHYGACNQSGCGGGVNSRATFEGYLRHQSIARPL